MPMLDFTPTDSCARCGLRQATRALEEKGITLRLCDSCYWGREDVVGLRLGNVLVPQTGNKTTGE